MNEKPTIKTCTLGDAIGDCFVVLPPMGQRIAGCHFVYDAQEVHIVLKPRPCGEKG